MTEIVPVTPSTLLQPEPIDIIERLLQDKRSPNTRHAYQKDLRDFFNFLAQSPPTPELVAQFLSLPRFDAIAKVFKYKAWLMDKGLSEATVNRRLSAIKSMVRLAQNLGKCSWSLDHIKGEKVRQYRDTSGIARQDFKRVLENCDRSTLKGKRDYALLRLLWDNALRRGEIAKCNIQDFNAERRTLKIRGKGRGTEVEVIHLANSTVQALLAWLQARRELKVKAPLFVSLDRAHKGHRLTGSAIYGIVQQACLEAGISKKMSPHRIRHSSITAALDMTDGNVRKAQKLSRHRNLNTLMIYDDNRNQDQLELSELLANLT
ncbi:MAG: tyrosine-type recombinase/integrase [Cyanobacteria bacterium P01_E01_bin.42]